MSLTEAQAEMIERLRGRARQLDNAGDGLGYYSRADAIFDREAADALASSQEEIERLRKALEPFAKAADCHSDDKSFMPDAMLIWRGGECVIRLGDLRAARALASKAGAA